MTFTMGPWTLVQTEWKSKRDVNQGVTTLRNGGPSSRLVFRGDNSVAGDLRAKGWDHVGDPDSWGGAIFDAYQKSGDGVRSKLFRVAGPDGTVLDFEHALMPGPEPELPNNSFVAVSPDGQWLVSGEWFDMKRLLLFPTPTVNAGAPPAGHNLPLAGIIELDHTVRDIQGAVFIDETTLLCSSNDTEPAGSPRLWYNTKRPLLRVSLAAELPNLSQPATVDCVGTIPAPGIGIGNPEVEGIDYDRTTGDLRIVVVPAPPLGYLTAAVLRFRIR